MKVFFILEFPGWLRAFIEGKTDRQSTQPTENERTGVAISRPGRAGGRIDSL